MRVFSCNKNDRTASPVHYQRKSFPQSPAELQNHERSAATGDDSNTTAGPINIFTPLLVFSFYQQHEEKTHCHQA